MKILKHCFLIVYAFFNLFLVTACLLYIIIGACLEKKTIEGSYGKSNFGA